MTYVDNSGLAKLSPVISVDDVGNIVRSTLGDQRLILSVLLGPALGLLRIVPPRVRCAMGDLERASLLLVLQRL